jgi:hypothetical protein
VIPDGLGLSGNDALVDLDALEDVSFVGSLLVIDNAALTELDGLDAVTSIDGALTIWSNPSLTRLGLASLYWVGGGISISDNPIPPEEIEAFEDRVDEPIDTSW